MTRHGRMLVEVLYESEDREPEEEWSLICPRCQRAERWIADTCFPGAYWQFLEEYYDHGRSLADLLKEYVNDYLVVPWDLPHHCRRILWRRARDAWWRMARNVPARLARNFRWRWHRARDALMHPLRRRMRRARRALARESVLATRWLAAIVFAGVCTAAIMCTVVLLPIWWPICRAVGCLYGEER